MSQRIRFTITAFSFLLPLVLARPAAGNILWSWSFGTEAGTFVTDGDLVGGIAPPGTYTLDPSTFSVTASFVGACIGGSYDEGPQPSQWFDWDGTAPTRFYRANGLYDNGTNMYLLPTGEYRYTLYAVGGPPGGLLVYDDDVNIVEAALTVEPIAAPVAAEVTIDIKPGSWPNSINPNARGVIPVAILTTDDFDASTVDPATVALEGVLSEGKGKSGKSGSLEDVDHDGDLDLVVQIPNTIDWADDATEATLTGMTWDGIPIQGTDSVRIVPPE